MGKKIHFLLSMLILMLASCSKSDIEKVEFIPFLESENGQWGMISPEGEVLFSEEFKSEPTMVKEGRFMVKNSDEYWEIFTAEAKPQKIGTEYAHATSFNNGRALVSERNKPVSIIDTNGKVIKLLDKIEGKVVDEVDAFSDGYAVYKTGDYYGAIDENGKPVIKAEYVVLFPCSDGKFIGIHKKYEDAHKKDDKSKIMLSVLDTSGKKLFDISNDKYPNIGTCFQEGLLKVAVKKDGNECWGLINDKNEVVLKPTAKIKEITDIKGDLFIYGNGDGHGVMNIKGENIIRAKYDYLNFDIDDRLVAITIKNKKTQECSCKYIDSKDNQIGEETFVGIRSLRSLDGKHGLVKISDKLWSIVNEKGEQLEKLPDMVDIGVSLGEGTVESDYVDFTALFDELNLSADGVDSLTFKTPAKKVVFRRAEFETDGGTDDHPVADPYWYDYTNKVSYMRPVANLYAHIDVNFYNNVSRQTYRNERVNYWEDEDYVYYYNNKIPTGYAFNDTYPNQITVGFFNYNKMKGKLKMLVSELKARFKKYGKLVKENSGAAVFELNNGYRAIIAMDKRFVMVSWGDLKPAKDIDIDKYKDIEEKLVDDEEDEEKTDSDD